MYYCNGKSFTYCGRGLVVKLIPSDALNVSVELVVVAESSNLGVIVNTEES